MFEGSNDVAPRPWSVEETPNGVYLRGADGIRFAIVLGKRDKQQATAQFIADTANTKWLRIISNSPVPADDGDGPPVAAA